MIFANKHRAIYRKRRPVILALLAAGFAALISTPLSGSMFRSRAAGATRTRPFRWSFHSGRRAGGVPPTYLRSCARSAN